jgi:hypothetical protein
MNPRTDEPPNPEPTNPEPTNPRIYAGPNAYGGDGPVTTTVTPASSAARSSARR